MSSHRILASIPFDGGHPANRRLFSSALRDGLAALGTVTWNHERRPAAWLDLLRAANPTVMVGTWGSPVLTPEALAAAPALRAYVYLAGSVRTQVDRAAIEQGLVVSNWGEVPGPYVAEATVAMLLAAMRQLCWFDAALHAGRWRNHASDPAVHSLRGRRVGIHGCGAIGRALAPLLLPFGCTVAGHDPHVPAATLTAHCIEPIADAQTLYRTSFAVINLLPAIPATQHLVGADLLRLLPDGGVYVLPGRAATTDFAALIAELQSGRLRAALDVFDREPLALDSPLRTLPNCVLQPHLGMSDDATDAMVTHGLARLRRWCADGVMPDAITLDRYDGMT